MSNRLPGMGARDECRSGMAQAQRPSSFRWFGGPALGLALTIIAPARAADLPVRDAAGFRAAVARARPGDRVLLAPGNYGAGFSFSNVRSEAGRPIRIAAADPANPPRFQGGSQCLHFSDAVYLELDGLSLSGASANGLNVDDGGSYETPSHHVTLRNLVVTDVGPQGNRDAIKLSGLDDFEVRNCRIERWGSGGSAIDMVGCHQGRIEGCTFRQGGATGVQMKGGTSRITVRGCRFDGGGQRAVNIGGSTGLEYFRPKPEGFEAKEIEVVRNVFVGSDAPLAFVGCDGAVVRSNTFYLPGRWLLRILRETNAPGFVPTRGGVLENNLIVFRSDRWGEGGVNLGPRTGIAPETFRFQRNFWFCEDRPDRSRPTLPAAETDGAYGRDPLLTNPAAGDFRLKPGSPASGKGAM